MTGSFFPRGWPTESDWTSRLESFFQTPGFRALCEFVELQRAAHTIYPTEENVFRAFRLTPYQATKVVILGQDPYHGPGQAHGLCFSVLPGVRIPPSLANIYREIESDLGLAPPDHGYLQSWAEQGVLLLNAVLTVERGQAGSHQGKGWETFTDRIVQLLNSEREGLVFMLWGSYAMKKGTVIDRRKHLVLKAPHPSPLSAHRGFLGCRHFSAANAYLQERQHEPIDWSVPKS